MASLFYRYFRLTLQVGDNELVYEPPMQIRFTVDVNEGTSGGIAQITLYGTKPETRKLIKHHARITLSAGYLERFGLIFDGEIINIETGREGPSQYVRFYARTEAQKREATPVRRTWGEGATQLQIILDVAAAFVLPVEIVGDFSDLARAIKGRTLSGPAIEVMNELADIHRFRWLIDRGRMVIIRNSAIRDTPPKLISADTGMVGSPQILLQQVEVKTKLDSSVLPRDTIDVRAEARNFAFSGVFYATNTDPTGGTGLYDVINLTHEGDYYGDTWDTSIRGLRPL